MSEADDLRAAFDRVSWALNAEIPAEQAENDGWPQRAMPGMLAELGLSQEPELFWFVNATNPMYDAAPPDAWRYCHFDDGRGPVVLGLSYHGDPPRVGLRADMSLTKTLQTLGHELWHVRAHRDGTEHDEDAADEFGAQTAARFLASQYR